MIGKIISLSLIEKFLLKNGWLVKDSFDPASRTLLTRARREIPPDELIYPKPTYYYHRRPAEEVLGHVLEDLGRLETLDHSSLVLKINQSLETPPPGFDCRLCGQCCRRMRDAFQGLVTREEVRYWRAMGHGKNPAPGPGKNHARIHRLRSLGQSQNRGVFQALPLAGPVGRLEPFPLPDPRVQAHQVPGFSLFPRAGGIQRLSCF